MQELNPITGIKTILEGNKYRVAIEISDNDNYNFEWHLIRDCNHWYPTIASSEKEKIYDLNKPGIYYCLIGVFKNGIKIGNFCSEPRQYFTDEYKNILNKQYDDFTSVPYSLKFSQSSYPNGDFCLFNTRISLTNNIKDFYYVQNINNSGFSVLSSTPLIANNGNKYILCGSMVANTPHPSYFFGYKDLIDLPYDLSKISTEIGDYNFVKFTDSEILLFNDFHGQGKLYYYNFDNKYIISNRLHLLLLIMKLSEIKILINLDKILATLCVSYKDMLTCNYISETFAAGVYVTRCGESIIIKDRRAFITHTEAYNIINTPPHKISADEYDQLLTNGVNEIKNNIHAILENKQISKVVSELTGGMDSRTVFAAITTQEDKSKLTLSTYRAPDRPDDLPISLSLASLSSIPYSNNQYTTYKDNDKDIVSHCLDQKYNYPHYKFHGVGDNQDILKLNGTYGEVQLRLRYGNTLFKHHITRFSRSLKEFTSLWVDHWAVTSMICDGLEFKKYIFKNLLKELCDSSLYTENEYLEESTLINILENNYLNYSHAFHCIPKCLSEFILYSFAPIKSKSLLTLHRKVSSLIPDCKIGFDVTYKLNPLTLEIRYDTTNYNSRLKKYREEKLCEHEVFLDEAVINRLPLPTEQYNASIKETKPATSKEVYSYTLNDIHSMLKYLLTSEYGMNLDKLKLPLLHFLKKKNKSKVDMDIIFLKLAMITSILNLNSIDSDTIKF